MSSTTQISLPALQLQLRQIIDHLEVLADEPDALNNWGPEVAEAFEDESERLSDLSTRVAMAHRKGSARVEMSLSPSKKAMNR